MWVRSFIALMLLFLVGIPLLAAAGFEPKVVLEFALIGFLGIGIVMLPIELIVALGVLFCEKNYHKAPRAA